MNDRHIVQTCALIGVMVVLGPIIGTFVSWANATSTQAAASSPAGVVRLLAPPTAPTVTVNAQVEAASNAPPAADAQAQAASAAPPATAPPPSTAPAAAPAVKPVEPAAAPAPATGQAAAAAPAPPAAPQSILAGNQMVVFYGKPSSAYLGILGVFDPEDAANRVKEEAGIYDRLNGDRGAVGALDLVYSGVTADPTGNGLYLNYLSDDQVNNYLAVAEKYDLQLFLDLQIGRSTVIDEVRKIERYLKNPRVHVAIDPEYAVGPQGLPIQTPGSITGDDINAVQSYLSDLVDREHIAPKLLVVHQYMDDTIVDGSAARTFPNVDLILNMDAYGDQDAKLEKYLHFAAKPYANKKAFNIFLHYDQHVLTEQEAIDLNPSPDVIFYQ